MKMKGMTIGVVAQWARVGKETVRFYEKRGLIPEPPRTAAGYRQYPAETVARLGFIQRAQELGFSLREIAELLDLRSEEVTCSADIRERAEAKIRDIDARIRDLRRMRSKLDELTRACTASGAAAHCAILEALDDEASDI